jgi:putative oxidoreductase
VLTERCHIGSSSSAPGTLPAVLTIDRRDEVLARLVGSRVSGGAAALVAAGRIATGAFFVLASTGKFTNHAAEVADFGHWGVPLPEISTYLAGAVELVGGAALVVGLFTRLAAYALGLDLAVAIATAGRVDGGPFHLGVAPALVIVMVGLIWSGAGAWSVDRRLFVRIASRHGVPAGGGSRTDR